MDNRKEFYIELTDFIEIEILYDLFKMKAKYVVRMLKELLLDEENKSNLKIPSFSLTNEKLSLINNFFEELSDTDLKGICELDKIGGYSRDLFIYRPELNINLIKCKNYMKLIKKITSLLTSVFIRLESVYNMSLTVTKSTDKSKCFELFISLIRLMHHLFDLLKNNSINLPEKMVKTAAKMNEILTFNYKLSVV